MIKRIIYLTTINLNSKRAQSLQVKKFVKSLTNTTNKKQIEFKAFSLGSVPEEYKNYFKSPCMKLFKNRYLNNLYCGT